ncbi:hypothetical protein I3U60_05255 [Mycobacteroides abscessus subsp. massiliense]|uniref:hypothetical protein n=1 Tax=Mycobacteroides abscessus TaxID=36809 RepID=UPI0019D133D5|nr:hypothetical protein [Mycobacteroides abscessus]MBN7375688.1 hypothetical protein [Mycobacteroides abscessus subsp. massiliense]
MSTEEEMWRVLNARADQQADKWYKPAGVGLLTGVIGTAIAVSNHPTPTWAVVMAGLGGLVCFVSFAIPMSGAYRDGNRLESYVNSTSSVEDYPDDDFDDELDDDEGFEYPAITEPTPSAPVAPAPPASGSLLSSLRQQGGAQ